MSIEAKKYNVEDKSLNSNIVKTCTQKIAAISIGGAIRAMNTKAEKCNVEDKSLYGNIVKYTNKWISKTRFDK